MAEETLISEPVPSASAMVSPTADTSAESGTLSPVESAILCMDKELRQGMLLIRDIKNQTAMLETAFKLMSYELGVISKEMSGK